MTPYLIWIITAPILLWAVILFPSFRIFTVPVFISHQILLVLGINNLRINFFHKSYWHGNRKSKDISITFDDGPDPTLTPLILDLLLKYQFKATFFLIANKVKDNPQIIKRMVNEGHTIASHDLHHSFLSNFRKSDTIYDDLSKSIEIIENASGKKTSLYRPPVGLSNPNYRKVLKELDLHCISWSRKPYDAGNRRLGGIKNIVFKPKGGDIILLHDALPMPQYKDYILEKLEELFQTILKQKLNPVTVDKLLQIKPYK